RQVSRGGGGGDPPGTTVSAALRVAQPLEMMAQTTVAAAQCTNPERFENPGVITLLDPTHDGPKLSDNRIARGAPSMNGPPTSLDFLAAIVILIILVISGFTLLGTGILMAIGAVFSKRPLVTSWPSEQEHSFHSFEQR